MAVNSFPFGEIGEQGFGNRQETWLMTRLYMAIKRDSWQLTGREIQLEKRKELFQYIRMKREEALVEGQNSFEISINVPMHSKHNIYLRGLRRLSYKIPAKRPIR